MIKETRLRSFIKTILWRLIAVSNSFFILSFFIKNSALMNAIYMNITGALIYYFYERFWNKIDRGKIIKN